MEVVDNEGNIVTDKEFVLNKWKNCFANLFNSSGNNNVDNNVDINIPEFDNEISVDEM